MSDVLDANLAQLLRRAYVPALPAAEFRTRLEKSLRRELARQRGTFAHARPLSRPLLALAAAILMLLAGTLFWLTRKGPEDCGAILARGELAWRRAAEEPWGSLPRPRAERGFDLAVGTLELATPLEFGTQVRLAAGTAELASASRASFDAAGSALTLREGGLALEHRSEAPEWRLATEEGVLAIGSAELLVALGPRGLQVRVERGSVWFEHGDARLALLAGREAWLVDGEIFDGDTADHTALAQIGPAEGERRAVEPGSFLPLPVLPLPALEGRVRDQETGASVPRFEVALVRQREEHDFFAPIVREVEDAAGCFRWEGVQAHAYEVFVHADGYALRYAGTIDGRSREPFAALEVELERGNTRSGRVVDAESGDPIAGALVLSEEDTPAFGLPYQTEAAELYYPIAAKSGADGGFVLEHLSTGRHRLRVTASGYGVAYGKRFDTAVGGGEPLLFALQQGATVRGRVTGPKGEPAGGRRLIVTPMESDLDLHRQLNFTLAETDATGSYVAADLPGGEMLVILVGESPHEELNEVKAAVVTPGAEVRVDFEGEKTGTRVVGRLLDAAGVPLASRNLAIYRCANGTLDYQSFVGTSSDGEGRFEIEGLPPGPHTVFLIGSMGRTIQWIEEIEVLEMVEQTQDLELSEGVIEGTTRSALDGSALPRSVIVLQRHIEAGGARDSGAALEFAGWILADDEGRFRFAGLSFGVYELSAYAITGDFGFEHTEAFGLDASAASKTLDLRHYPGGQVRVLVVDASGTPVVGAAVSFLDERGREFGFDRNPVTDGQGVHLARGCRPGSFTVVALCADGRRGTSPLDCKIGQMNEVKITLETPSESAK